MAKSAPLSMKPSSAMFSSLVSRLISPPIPHSSNGVVKRMPELSVATIRSSTAVHSFLQSGGPRRTGQCGPRGHQAAQRLAQAAFRRDSQDGGGEDDLA